MRALREVRAAFAQSRADAEHGRRLREASPSVPLTSLAQARAALAAMIGRRVSVAWGAAARGARVAAATEGVLGDGASVASDSEGHFPPEWSFAVGEVFFALHPNDLDRVGVLDDGVYLQAGAVNVAVTALPDERRNGGGHAR